MAFEATLEMKDGIAMIRLDGELDAGSAPDFKIRVEEAAAADPQKLVLDMTELSFMASAGLRVLIFTKQKMGSAADVFVIGLQDPVRETMEMTGFHRSVIILDEYDAAQIEGN